jgi:hypothetical protein
MVAKADPVDPPDGPSAEKLAGMLAQLAYSQLTGRRHSLAPSPALCEEPVQGVSQRAVTARSREDPTVDWAILINNLVHLRCPELEEKQSLAVKAEDLGASIFVRITIVLSVIIAGSNTCTHPRSS